MSSYPIQLKASFYTLTVLQLSSCHSVQIESQMQKWVHEMPQLFQGMPIIIGLPEATQNAFDVVKVVECMRHYGLVPIGIQGGDSQQREVARQLNLAIFLLKEDSPNQEPTFKHAVLQKKAFSSHPMIVDNVRSGQRVHAKSDLIVLHSVSPGAEVSAEGNIHVYGTLSGRALAGTQDNKKACIFCNQIQAELIAISGYYWQYEHLQRFPHTQNVCIFLENKELKLRILG